MIYTAPTKVNPNSSYNSHDLTLITSALKTLVPSAAPDEEVEDASRLLVQFKIQT